MCGACSALLGQRWACGFCRRAGATGSRMYGQGNKYGAEPGDALGLLLAARRLGLDVAGVCFHVGSGATNPQARPASFGQPVSPGG